MYCLSLGIFKASCPNAINNAKKLFYYFQIKFTNIITPNAEINFK